MFKGGLKTTRSIKHILSLGISCFTLFNASTVHAQASFQGLGDLTGDPAYFHSRAYGISSDGTVVVGESSTISSTGTFQGNEAFRWTENEGMIGLGELPGGGFYSSALDVSANGTVIVGQGRSNAAGLNSDVFEAFRWTSTDGMVRLGDLSGGIFKSEATNVSADGEVIVGSSYSSSGNEAYRWTSGSGMVGIGDIPGGIFDSRALDVSSDGTVVIGFSNSNLGNEAFRWTNSGGMVGLGDLPGGIFNSQATGISANGSVVVGFGKSALGNEAFLWTTEGGMVGLSDLSGGEFGSVATDISADGSVVIGDGKTILGDESFVWDNTNGMRNVREMLINDFGLESELSGWKLTNARGISGNGLVITGFGINPQGYTEAWTATISEPATLSLLALGGLALLRRGRFSTSPDRQGGGSFDLQTAR